MNAITNLRALQRTFPQAFRTYHTPYRIHTANAGRSLSIATRHKHHPAPRTISAHQFRAHSTEPSVDDNSRPPKPLTDRADTSPTDAEAIAARKALSPAYQLWFTCKMCLERSGHTVSKQAYHFGTCVINCPKCKSQHLISDHLKIFSDTKMTMEDIAREHGEKLRKGRLGVDGDVEFYDEEAEKIVAADEQTKLEQDALYRGSRKIGRSEDAA